MRPIKLTMQAFGPYANKVTVDFDKLGNNGIYLITGDTGAGKSTIFDGITYALFDKTSLEEREPTSLRSKYAKQETTTEVELTFIYDGKTYTIKRTPQYEYITRNNTVGKKDSTVELTMPDGKVYTGKKKETDNKISEIIGLEYEQFRRIVMIAQGDFKQLLLDKKGRGEIFRKIFDTSPYVRLQEALKDERRILGNECEVSDKTIKQSINDFYYDETDDLNVELLEIQESDSYNVEMTSKLINKMNEKDNKLIAKNKEELDKIESKLKELHEKLGAVSKIRKIQEGLEQAKQDKKDADAISKKLTIDYEKAQKQKPEIDKNKKEAALLEEELEKYKDLENRNKELDKIQAKQDTLIDDQEELQKQIAKLEKDFEKNKKELESLKDIDVEYQKVDALLKSQSKLAEELEDFEAQLGEYEESNKSVKKLEKEYIEASDKTQDATDKHSEANRLFLDNQAGVLAKTLSKNKPCPVCGSLDHPNCAKSIDKAPSEEELKKLEKLMNDALKLQKSKAETLNKIKGELESSGKTLSKLAKKLLDNDALEEAPKLLKDKNKEVSELLEELEEKQELLEDKQERKIELDKFVKKAEQTIKKHQEELAKLNEQISSNDASIKGQTSEIEKIAKKLQYEDLDEAKDALADMNKFIKETEKVLKDSENKLKKASEDVAKYDGLIKGYQEQLKGNTIKVDDSLEDEIAELEERKQELNDNKEEISNRLSNNERTLASIEKTYKQIAATQKKLEWVTTLCNTANGTLKGKDKVSFETYIQMSYFDRILAFGNSRLEIMTNGQYSFIRGDEGLELNVIDHYNGTTREVSTLSGGESFMASLSLALGMSDEVQSRATSIQIDTLFVDEGFGSLDGDTLNKALDALHELSQGNRLVGIISHVDELKNRIDKKIVVTKDKANGSEIRYEI